MRKAKNQMIIRVSLLILFIALALYMNYYGQPEDTLTQGPMKSGVVEVHFIDVGQGDSILIEAENETMLIDVGDNNKGKTVVDYLTSQNITELDYVIGTHPHSDHIGGLDTVLKQFPVNMIIMPYVNHTTQTYEEVLNVIEDKNLSLIKPTVGTEYQLGPATFTILAPVSASYEDLNNYSIVIKLCYGDNSFLLTGDAGSLSEEEMLADGNDLHADVLKLGHHGSSYSTTDDFLDAVDPIYTVVSVGADNNYGHPHPETLKKIKDRNIKLYCTDKQGTVVFTSDGKTVSVNTQEHEITDEELKD